MSQKIHSGVFVDMSINEYKGRIEGKVYQELFKLLKVKSATTRTNHKSKIYIQANNRDIWHVKVNQLSECFIGF